MHKIIILNITILFSFGVSLCLASEIKKEDKNNDGKPDMWLYYENNMPAKIESDRNYDGKVDLWVYYVKDGTKVAQIDMNFDGKPDMYSYYQYGQRKKLEIDSDYDGKLDQVHEYMNGRLVKMQKASKNGKLETVFDITNRYSPKQKHTEYYETHSQPFENGKALSEKQNPK